MKFKNIFMMATLVAVLFLSGCGTPKIEVSDKAGANEVGIVYTLEGDVISNQGTLDPRELKPEMVQGRLVIHPQRKRYTGFWFQWWSYDWLPTTRMVKISLLPVSQKWTPDPNSGTSQRDDTIRVESSNSIGVRLGVTIQTRIDDVETYAYYFANKPLAEVTDDVVWGRAQRTAAHFFGGIHVDNLRAKLSQGRDKVKEDLDEFCKQYGIEVVTFGWFGGIAYDPAEPINQKERNNPEVLKDLDIQIALNRIFKAENDILVAEEDQVKKLRELNIEKDRALAERRQALLTWAAREGTLTRVRLDLLAEANSANATFVEQWNGQTSDIVPAGYGPFWFLEQNPVQYYIDRIEKLASVDNPSLDELAAKEVEIAAKDAEKAQKELEERRVRESGKKMATEEPEGSAPVAETLN